MLLGLGSTGAGTTGGMQETKYVLQIFTDSDGYNSGRTYYLQVRFRGSISHLGESFARLLDSRADG